MSPGAFAAPSVVDVLVTADSAKSVVAPATPSAGKPLVSVAEGPLEPSPVNCVAGDAGPNVIAAVVIAAGDSESDSPCGVSASEIVPVPAATFAEENAGPPDEIEHPGTPSARRATTKGIDRRARMAAALSVAMTNSCYAGVALVS